MKLTLVLTMAIWGAALHAADGADGKDAPEACTNATAAGTYSVTCTGWTAAGPNGSLVPIKQVGVATGDRDGNFTGSTTINVGGQLVIPNFPANGKATVAPDCTGNVTYNKGTPAELNITFVVNPAAKELHGLVTDKGSVVSCTLKRMTN